MTRRLVGATVLWICLTGAVACGGTSGTVAGQEGVQSAETDNLAAEQSLRDAALEGRIETMAAALDEGARINATDEGGRTALMYAAFNGHAECVRWLFDRGAKVGEREAMGRTALMFASTGPFPETVRLLLELRSNPHLADQYEGWTPLMFAAGEGQLEVIRVLLEHGAKASDKDFDGDVAADHAGRNGHPEAEALLRSLKKE